MAKFGLKKLMSLVSNKLKSWELKNDPSAHKLATMNALNRRKNTRIKYSHMGAVGDLPRVFHENEEMVVGNISTGGLLIIDDNESFKHAAGEITIFRLLWPDLEIETKAKVVGAQYQSRHVQFIDFNPVAFVRISQLIKSGFLGSRFHRVRDDHKMLDASELWLGPAGESLLFPRDAEKAGSQVTYNTGKRNLIIRATVRPFWIDTSEPISKVMLSDLLVMLSNFHEPSNHIKDLIELLQEHYDMRPSLKTGTGD